MKPIEKRDINNPREWVVDGTNIFIIPQAVVQSSDPTSSKFTIRHGSFIEDNGILLGIGSDVLENGYEDVGGFHTFDDVINYIDWEASNCEGIFKYASLGLYDKAADFFMNANKNNRIKVTREGAIKRIEHTPLKSLENRAIAWRQIHSDCLDAKNRGILKPEIHLGNNVN